MISSGIPRCGDSYPPLQQVEDMLKGWAIVVGF